VVTAQQAIAAARAHVAGAEATVIGPPELLYYTGGGATILAWRVFVPASLRARWWVVVDAATGAIANAWNAVEDTDFVGSGTGGLNEPETIHVWNEAPSSFFLVDTSKAMFQPGASNPPDPDTTFGGIVVLDARNQPPNDDPQSFPTLFHVTSTTGAGPWTSGSATNVADGVSALANLSHTYDYYLGVHGRNSIDGNGASLLGVVRLGLNFQNAFFMSENNIMAFGDADEYASALDVVGHELTHGVTHHTANLIYQNESGALNEAFSDIFGEMVEAQTTGDNDWLIGTNLAVGGPVRNMANPAQFGDPKLYSQFVHTNADSGGVHTNSGILNHCYFQLAEGLPNAVGRAKAEAIFYRALSVHLTASAQYVDARLAAVQSAQELVGTLGITANDVQAVRDAFDLVQVFDGTPTDPPDPFPGTQGPDSTIFLFTDLNSLVTTLWRQEDALGDAPDGDQISATPLKQARPAVTGDGTLAFYVNENQTLCINTTDASTIEDCDPTFDGLVSSISVSPDGNLFGFVLRDPDTGERENVINVFDIRKPEGQDLREITVEAPVIDGSTIDTILYADAMDFSADDQTLLFDALTSIQFTGTGGADEVEVWAIYAVDLATEPPRIFSVIPPTPRLDIGYPAFAQTSDNHLVFDVVDEAGVGTVVAGNLDTGALQAVVQDVDRFGIPSYTGDDTQVVFTDFDGGGLSLFAQPVAADRITPVGGASLWIFEGSFGVIYRRGDFVPEPAAAALGAAALAALAGVARRRRR
jgi:Zn-dependent metalloprotease